MACVYICCPSCNGFWSLRSKSCIHTFLLCWIYVITGWKIQAFQELCGKDQVFTSELEYHFIGYLYQLMLYFKQFNIMNPPYISVQIGDLSNSEEDVQSTNNLLRPSKKYIVLWQIINKIRKSNIPPSSTNIPVITKTSFFMAVLILSIAPT